MTACSLPPVDYLSNDKNAQGDLSLSMPSDWGAVCLGVTPHGNYVWKMANGRIQLFTGFGRPV